MKLRGIFAASVTAVAADGRIDRDRTLDHLRDLFDRGCHGIALFGTTGESASFTVADRQAMLAHAVDAGVPTDRLVVGVGVCARDDTLALAHHALEAGCRHLLMLPPFFFKGVSDQGVIDAYTEVLSGLPAEARIILYHFPKVSAVPINHAVISALGERFGSKIAGIKDSSADLEHTLALIEAFPDLSIFPGADHHLLATLQAGGAGSISAAANLSSAGSRLVFDLFQAGAIGQAERAQELVTGVRKAVEGGSLIATIKALLAQRRNDAEWKRVRPPLEALGDDSALQPVIQALANLERNV